jgi:glycosyltransferase involved in cell wall biosynthesis
MAVSASTPRAVRPPRGLRRALRVNLVYNRIPHHAGPSGYDQVARHLERYATVTTIDGVGYEVLPSVWEWVAEHWRSPIQAVSGLEWYDPYAASLEATAAARLLRSRDETFHFLYGENSYRFVEVLAPVARRRGHKLLATYHQPPDLFERVVRSRRHLRALDGVVALCETQAEYLRSVVGPDKVFTVRHGVDVEAFHPADPRDVDRGVCLCVGRWLRDFEMLRSVAERVAEIAPDVRFVVIGREDDVSWLDELPNVETRSDVSDGELLAAYRTAGMLILPLTDCTANNALLEGMASGLPVIATAVGGIGDYVDERCGVLVGAGNADAMAHAVAALARDARRRDALAHGSRERAQTFAWESIAAELAGVYGAVSAERPLTRASAPDRFATGEASG